jgi:hypothetical protein
MKFHNLRDQNLLRHNEIQKKIGDHLTLVSDSIDFYSLIKITFYSLKKNYIVHALELYSVSYGACLSEYKYRWSVISGNKSLFLKSYLGFMAAILRVYLLRIVAKSSNLMIISSEKRRKYLIKEGLKFSIFVVKNKPVFDSVKINIDTIRDRSIIVMIGNMYSVKEDFIKVVNFASINNMVLHCYGLSIDDELWIRSKKFLNVKIFKRVSQEVISQILQSTQFSVCLYSNISINNRYSSSSKIFELLYYGVIPIVSINEGLKYELDSLGAAYIKIDEQINNSNIDINNNSLIYSDLCDFKSELIELNALKENLVI